VHIRIRILIALLLCLVPFLGAQAAADATGHWEGAIHAPFGEVGIEIDLAKNAKGQFIGTFSRPDQHLMGLPLSNVAVDGKSVAFELKVNQGGGPFDGTLAPDGKSMSGVFATYGTTVAFDLTRKGEARIEPAGKSAPISKQLEGTWKGTLNVDGKRLELVMTVSNQPDGTATGSIISDGLEIPITFKQEGSIVSIDLKSVGESYSGKLNAEGTELTGTLTQAAIAMPLTFRRSGEMEVKK
jgi:hypothetical protein